MEVADAQGTGMLVKEPSCRLVSESVSPVYHVQMAQRLAFPQQLSALEVDDDVSAAVEQCVLLGTKVVGWRADRIRVLQRIKKSLSRRYWK